MAKIDKSLYSKEQWKLIKEQRRKEKQKIQEQIAPVSTDKNTKRYVLCLKHGDKYSSEYVNILKKMVDRHLTLDYEFICLTDNNKGLDSDIKIINLPQGLSGWWCKPYMFSGDLPLDGIVLYIDLDVVIANNIDKLFLYQPGRWCTIRDFTKVQRPNWNRYNSSVIRFNSGSLNYLWKEFSANKDFITRKYFGDQDWLWDRTHNDNPAMCFPDDWIMSWKWQIRKSKDLNYRMPRGSRTLKTIENVTPPKDCCITVFHGDPNPHICEDPWVVENWR